MNIGDVVRPQDLSDFYDTHADLLSYKVDDHEKVLAFLKIAST